MKPYLTLLLIASIACGCAFSTEDSDTSGGGDTTGGSDTGIPTARTYDELREKLYPNRTVFQTTDEDTYNLADAETRLFWSRQSLNTDVMSYSVLDQQTLSYPFRGIDAEHIAVSASLYATSTSFADTITFLVYPANGADTSYTLEIQETSAGMTAFDAYGDEIILLSQQGDEDLLMVWRPLDGETTASPLFSPVLGGWTGGAIETLVVYGDHIVMLGEGSLGWATRTSQSVQMLAFDTIESIDDVGSAGVVYRTMENAMVYFDFDRQTTFDIDAALRDHAPVVPERDTAHLPLDKHPATLYAQTLVYIGEDGLFAYDTGTEQLRPVLLEALGYPREEYRNARALDDGSLFVDTLFTETNSLGNEGPLYRLAL